MKKLLLLLLAAVSLTASAETGFLGNGQDPKVMTTLPMDSMIIMSPFSQFPAGATLTQFTVIASDITEKFVGNTIKQIATVLPEDVAEAKLLIVDVNAPAGQEVLWSAEVNGTPNALSFFDCGFFIDHAYDLQVGLAVKFSKTTTPKCAIVPTFRYYGWYVTDDVYCNNQYYNYSEYLSFFGYKTYTGLAIYCITEGDGGFKDTDIYMEGAGVSRTFIGQDDKIQAEYRNYGVKPVTSAEFKYVLDGGEYTMTHEQPMGFLEIATVEAPFKSPSIPVRQSLEIYASKVNGETVENPTKSVGSVITINEAENNRRKAVMEEYTQMNCGWCPRGIVALDEMSKKYPDDFYAIAEHFNDDCFVTSYYPAMQKYCGGAFPSAYLNRLTKCDPYYGTSTVMTPSEAGYKPLAVADDIEKIFTLPTEAQLDITEATLDPSGAIMNVTTQAVFNIDCISCPYTVAYTLTEDGIEKCIQENYYSMSGNEYDKEPYLKPLTKEKQYYLATWSHVGRGIWESDEKLAESIVKGEKYANEIQFELPGDIKGDYVNHATDWSKVNLLAILLDDETGEMVNAKRVKLTDILSEADQAKLGIAVGIKSVNLEKEKTIYGVDGVKYPALQNGTNIVNGKKILK